MEEKKRKLKPMSRRKSPKSIPFKTLRDKVAEKTGLTKEDTDETIYAFLDEIREAILRKEFVRLPEIGILYPVIKPSRVGMALNGGKGKPKKMVVPDRWMLRFQDAKDLRRDLYEVPVSKEDVDHIYESEK